MEATFLHSRFRSEGTYKVKADGVCQRGNGKGSRSAYLSVRVVDNDRNSCRHIGDKHRLGFYLCTAAVEYAALAFPLLAAPLVADGAQLFQPLYCAGVRYICGTIW